MRSACGPTSKTWAQANLQELLDATSPCITAAAGKCHAVVSLQSHGAAFMRSSMWPCITCRRASHVQTIEGSFL